MRFGRFSGLVLSLFLPAFYRDVARNWGGIGFLYLLLLFTLTWIPMLITIHLGARKFADEDFPKIAQKLPDISIKNGKISSPAAQPLEIKDENGNVVFVLDTTGKIKTLDQTPAMILITENKLHQRDANGRIQIQDLNQMPDFDFTADWVQKWVDIICTWAAVGLYPIVMIGSLIRALVMMLIVSLIGLIVNAAASARVSYGGILRIAAVGMTLSVYIDTGLQLAGIAVPFWFFIATGLTAMYLAFGIAVSVPPPVAFVDTDDYRDDDRDDYDGPPGQEQENRRQTNFRADQVRRRDD